MSMSESERLRRTLEERPKYISRMKVRDSSELTGIKQARASTTEVPTTVLTTAERDGKSMDLVVRGKGVNMEYRSVLDKQQGCAVSAELDQTILPRVVLQGTPYDRRKEPFAQQDLSGAYAPTCKVSGFVQYFPPRVRRGPNCDYDYPLNPSG